MNNGVQDAAVVAGDFRVMVDGADDCCPSPVAAEGASPPGPMGVICEDDFRVGLSDNKVVIRPPIEVVRRGAEMWKDTIVGNFFEQKLPFLLVVGACAKCGHNLA
ncbi:hypothetical protein Nepgr_029608 [Nepenthes gracilis]|uniref:Uncharacterized protein n=1 Tax=Nepenthes gracilis TaxID=150966 RepID=A0AAD3Y502_NEPGR|nr:hypothetical protein Nepgr_029608 [Nepenthes gracilis]